MVMSGESVDVHTHLAPRFTTKDLAALDIAQDESGKYILADHAVGPKGLYEPEELLNFLVANEIGHTFVSAPPPFFRQKLKGEAKARWVTAINEGILRACELDSRLSALIYIPFEDPELAVQVVRENLVTEAAGWSGAAGGFSEPLDSKELVEVWNLLAADGRPVVLHPAKSPDVRLEAHYLHNLLGNPVETAVAVGELLFGGVLDKHENLNIVLVHCGGVVPQLASRWQRGIDTARPDVNTKLRPVLETLGRVYTDCLTHDGANVDLARTVFGDDRLLLGSDWPFPMGLDDPREPIRHLPKDLQEKISKENPTKLRTLHRTD